MPVLLDNMTACIVFGLQSKLAVLLSFTFSFDIFFLNSGGIWFLVIVFTQGLV